jgi:hypothetical protein
MLLLASAAVAQTIPAPTTGSRFNWPRTFAGQPDFEFSRADVVDDYYKQGKNQKPLPTLQDLLEGATIDPLGLAVPVSKTVSGTAVSGTTAAIVINEGSGAEPSQTELPALNVPAGLDLSEFKGAMQQRLREYLQNWNPDLRSYELSYLLRGLQLGGVMTSPERRAIINGVSYAVGDQLKASITVTPSDDELLNVLQEQMPDAKGLTPLQIKAYQQAYADEVAEIAKQRKEKPSLYQRIFTLPVTVRAIQSRKVTLEFNGVTYDLAIPFAM